MTQSTRWAAVSAMRRAPQEGQKPRRLHEKATSFSWPHSLQRRRRNPCARMPHCEECIELIFDKLGQGGPALGFDLRHETLDVFLDQLIRVVSSGRRRS